MDLLFGGKEKHVMYKGYMEARCNKQRLHRETHMYKGYMVEAPDVQGPYS